MMDSVIVICIHYLMVKYKIYWVRGIYKTRSLINYYLQTSILALLVYTNYIVYMDKIVIRSQLKLIYKYNEFIESTLQLDLINI